MTQHHPSTYAAYFGIEKNLLDDGIPVERSILVQEFTKGHHFGLTELSEWQYKEFLKWCNTKAQDLRVEHGIADKCDRMRKKIIALFHKMNWKLADGRIDIERVDAWCIKYSEYHKSLNQHRYKELVKLCTQVEKFHKTYLQ